MRKIFRHTATLSKSIRLELKIVSQTFVGFSLAIFLTSNEKAAGKD
jgi:hypothetical protein